MEHLGVWIAALLTLGIYSFLFKDNPVYKFVEHLFVGVSAGYWITKQWDNVLYKNMVEKFLEIPSLNAKQKFLEKTVAGLSSTKASLEYVYLNDVYSQEISRQISYDYLFVIPAALGLMMLLRLVPSIAWVSRWAMAFVVGVTSGLSIIIYLQANALAQIEASMQPLLVYEVVDTKQTAEVRGGQTAAAQPGVPPSEETGLVASAREKAIISGGGPEAPPKYALNLRKSIDAILLSVGVICALVYFFFSVEHKGFIFGSCSKLGIWFLMVSFGASFGYTIMGRISLLIGRMQFLLGDWLGIIK